MKPAADLIVHAAVGHRLTCAQDHLDRLRISEPPSGPKQECRLAGAGEFRGAAKSPMARVKLLLELRSGLFQEIGSEVKTGGAALTAGGSELVVQTLSGGDDILMAGLPKIRNIRQDLEKARAPVGTLRREIGSAVERLPIRSEKHRQWQIGRAHV